MPRSSIPAELLAALERGRDQDPRCDEEPWENYDDHTVPQVLEGVRVWIDEGDLSYVESVLFYEDAHKARKSIVSACIDALEDAGRIMPFWQRMRCVFELGYPNARRKLVHLAIALHADPFGRCWPKVSTLAGMSCGGDKRAGRRCIKELEEAGYLRRERRDRATGAPDSNLYMLTIPEGDEVGANMPPLADEPSGWGHHSPQGEGTTALRVGALHAAVEQPTEQPEERSSSTSSPSARKMTLKDAIQAQKRKSTKQTRKRPSARPQLADTHAGASSPGLSVVPDPPTGSEHSKRGGGKYTPTGSDDTPSSNGHERALTSGELRRAWKDRHGS